MKLFRKNNLLLALGLSLIPSQYAAAFNKNKDIYIAQFDSNADPDDIHSIAAIGSMLAHPDFQGVNYYAVAGAYGIQRDRGYIHAPQFFKLVFGRQNQKWTDAFDLGNQTTNWDASVTRVKNKVRPILDAGGQVWVAEAGQSDITADWVRALIAEGVPAAKIKANVIVVQHSDWNEEHTTPADLAYIKAKTTYRAINDGNGTSTARDPGGVSTPSYRSKNTSYKPAAENAPNLKSKQYWLEADWVIQDKGHLPGHSSITTGGVDFSDVVETWWIFNKRANINNIDKFWSRYVTNTPANNVLPQFVVPNRAYNNGSSDGDNDNTQGDGAWIEKDGLVVIEAESATLNSDWKKITAAPAGDPSMQGFTGDGYIQWTGRQYFGNTIPTANAKGIITYEVKINKPGVYSLRWRTKQQDAGQRGDAGNDNFVRFATGTTPAGETDFGQFTKIYIQNKKTWDLAVNAEPKHGKFVFNKFKRHFTAGTHKIQLAARSPGHSIDRFVLHHSSVGFNANTFVSSPESKREGASDGGNNGGNTGSNFTLGAVSDFTNLNVQGFARSYVDAARGVIAVSGPSGTEGASSTTFNGDSGLYRVKLTTLGEVDGESTYKLAVANKVVRSFRNARTTNDFAPQTKAWSGVALTKGDILRLQSTVDSNGLVPEGSGFATSRARWKSLEFTRTGDLPTNGGGNNGGGNNGGGNNGGGNNGGGNNGGGDTNINGPYNGTLRPIPGTIQAEHFNTGANGKAYKDLSPGNSGGVALRNPTDVDLENRTGTTGGANIGWIQEGEYWQYICDVTPGTYEIEVRVASKVANPGDLKVGLAGKALGTFPIVSTGGWSDWTTVKIPNVRIAESGKKWMRITTVNGGDFNFDWIRFTKLDLPPVTVAAEITDDAYLQNGNNVQGNIIRIQHTGPTREGYLRFNVSGIEGTVTGAKLSVQVDSDAGNGTISVYKANSNAWTETTLNATNAPSKGTLLASKTGVFSLGNTVEFDLGAEITGNGNTSFIVSINAGSNDVALSSKEGVSAPQLEVTYKP